MFTVMFTVISSWGIARGNKGNTPLPRPLSNMADTSLPTPFLMTFAHTPTTKHCTDVFTRMQCNRCSTSARH